MQDEYIDFDELIKNNVLNANEIETNMLLDAIDTNIDDKTNKIVDDEIYQLQTKNIKQAIIKHIGYAKIRPTMMITKFKFNGHTCKIISYVLNKTDLTEAQTSCRIKFLSLLVEKKNSIKSVLTMEYHTFNHIKDKTHIEQYITKGENEKIIEGYFAIYLKKYCNNMFIETKKEIIKTEYNKSNMVYLLLKHLSCEDVYK